MSPEELSRLYYEKKWSMQQIADHYGCHSTAIYDRMKRYGFERRSSSEATYVYLNPDGDPFKIIEPESREEIELFILGIALYMGEGTKRGTQVALANSDPKILRVFLLFLEELCGVPREDVKADLNIFDDCNVDESLDWWCDQLGLSRSQIYPPTIRESRGGNYKNRSVHGTLSIRYYNTKLLKIINNWCKEYCDKFSSMYHKNAPL